MQITTILAGVSLLLVGVFANPDENCLLFGGRCSLKGECKERTETGLCSTKGTECCIDGPEPRCTKYGGQCVTDCPKKIIESRAKDCAAGRQCCVYVE